MYTEPTRYQD